MIDLTYLPMPLKMLIITLVLFLAGWMIFRFIEYKERQRLKEIELDQNEQYLNHFIQRTNE